MLMSRRRFLTTSGRVAVSAALTSQLGWLSACSASSTNWDGLRRSLRGRLIAPGDPGYMAAALDSHFEAIGHPANLT